jgi:hypothetical protein
VSLGLAGDPDENIEETIAALKLSDSPVSVMNADEVSDMSYVSDFIDTYEEYAVTPHVAQFVREAVRIGKALTPIATEVLKIIRSTRADTNQRTIENA